MARLGHYIGRRARILPQRRLANDRDRIVCASHSPIHRKDVIYSVFACVPDVTLNDNKFSVLTFSLFVCVYVSLYLAVLCFSFAYLSLIEDTLDEVCACICVIRQPVVITIIFFQTSLFLLL